MSFLKRLFGGSKAGEAQAVGKPEEHKGFTIRATPFQQEGQFQTCGVISKDVGGEVKEHRFVRADRFPSADLAAEHAIRKARQIIDEQGEAVFR
ncbi:HlyU family transcriptional regulator [Chelativorans sp.]|uniref:HlyU family transcriptional regulator n=1 Tax=Chelativorans sp. TaxID=2203393 RepID=UPI002812292D|nr:HlyU family transcriptional regulator [Chelativorans sp.]